MNWRDMLATAGEVRELRESVQIALAFRQTAERERDAARLVCKTFATTNVRLAHRLEEAELLADDAQRIVAIFRRHIKDATVTDHVDDWLDRHEALKP